MSISLKSNEIKNRICGASRGRAAGHSSEAFEKNGRGSDAGFSLIEVIVVVLILAIAAGAAAMSLSAALRANTTRAATELSAVMSEARLESMSRPADSVELRVYKNAGDGKYYADVVMIKGGKMNATGAVTGGTEKTIESKVIASGAVTMTAVNSSSSAVGQFQITDARTAVIKFEKSSGKLRSFTAGTGSGFDSVVISGAKTSTVKIASMTGRPYVE